MTFAGSGQKSADPFFLGKPRGVTTKIGTFGHLDATAVTFAAVTCLTRASLYEKAWLNSDQLGWLAGWAGLIGWEVGWLAGWAAWAAWSAWRVAGSAGWPGWAE